MDQIGKNKTITIRNHSKSGTFMNDPSNWQGSEG